MKRFASRLISYGLSVCMMLSMIPFASALSFSDMPSENDWSYNALTAAIDNGLLQGSNGKVMPNGLLTRAQMAAIINRAFGAQERADISSYKDVPAQEWYAADIAKAVQMGTFQGDGTTMNPNGNITRQEAFIALVRAFKLEAADTAILNKFSDASQIDFWAKDSAAAIINAGYVEGNGNTLNPKGNITRAEFAQIMYKLINTYYNKADSYSETVTGNVMINQSGVVLKDMTVNGNVIVGDGVGNGEAEFNNVKVSGQVLVRGGGENTIRFVNHAEVGSVIVGKSCTGNVRIYSEKGVEINCIEIADGKDDIILEGAFDSVKVSDAAPVSLRNATVKEVEVSAQNASVKVTGDSVVQSVSISSAASTSTITVDRSAAINKVDSAASGVKIAGDGVVKEANISGNNTAVDIKDAKVTVADGISGVTQNGDKVNSTPAAVVGGGGGGSGSGSTPQAEVKFALDSDGFPTMRWVDAPNKAADANRVQFYATHEGAEASLFTTGDSSPISLKTLLTNDSGEYSNISMRYYHRSNTSTSSWTATTGGAQTNAKITITDAGTFNGVQATFYRVPGEEKFSYRLTGLDNDSVYDVVLLSSDEKYAQCVAWGISADSNGEAFGQGSDCEYIDAVGEKYYITKYSNFAVDTTGTHLTYDCKHTTPALVGTIQDLTVSPGTVTFSNSGGYLKINWQNPNGIYSGTESVCISVFDSLDKGWFARTDIGYSTNAMNLWIAGTSEDYVRKNLRVHYGKQDIDGNMVKTGDYYISDATMAVYCIGVDTAVAQFYKMGDDSYAYSITGAQANAAVQMELYHNGEWFTRCCALADSNGNAHGTFDCIYTNLTNCTYDIAERVNTTITNGGVDVSCDILSPSAERTITVTTLPQLPAVTNIRFETIDGEPCLTWDYDEVTYKSTRYIVYSSNNNGNTWDLVAQLNEKPMQLISALSEPTSWTNVRVVATNASIPRLYSTSQPADFACSLTVTANTTKQVSPTIQIIKTGIDGESGIQAYATLSGAVGLQEVDLVIKYISSNQDVIRLFPDASGRAMTSFNLWWDDTTYCLREYGNATLTSNTFDLSYTPLGDSTWRNTSTITTTATTGTHIKDLSFNENLFVKVNVDGAYPIVDQMIGVVSKDVGTNWIGEGKYSSGIRRNYDLYTGEDVTINKVKAFVLYAAEDDTWIAETSENSCNVTLTYGGALTGVSAEWTLRQGKYWDLTITGLSNGQVVDVVGATNKSFSWTWFASAGTADSNGQISLTGYSKALPYIYIRAYNNISTAGATVKDSGWISASIPQ